MEANTIRKIINLGKINFNGTGKRYPAEITIELRTRGGDPTFTIENGQHIPTGHTTPTYTELSICGDVWNTKHTDIVMGGQCLDEMSKYIKTPEFKKIYTWWKKYHLNGMHAGTPEQEAFLKDHFNGQRVDYSEQCEALKAANLYEVYFTGKTIGREYKNELYKFGHAWIINDIPENELNEIRDYINA